IYKFMLKDKIQKEAAFNVYRKGYILEPAKKNQMSEIYSDVQRFVERIPLFEDQKDSVIIYEEYKISDSVTDISIEEKDLFKVLTCFKMQDSQGSLPYEN
ncbi:Hypothetical predicted protein, partial [Mytilus galloprovincialis]